MTFRTILRSAFVFAATLLFGATAHAGVFRAYVSSTGSDANACTLPAPCRLLPAALAAVNDGGEIWMLDSANYNTATVIIGKSVSILAIPGAVGSVLATGGPAISITAPKLTVALRNLVIVPLPGTGGTHGVEMTGASALTIEKSLLANLAADGVHVAGTGNVAIADTNIRNNVGVAVYLNDGATANISNSRLLNNNSGGVLAQSDTATTTKAAVSDTVISGATNSSFGVFATSSIAGGAASIFVTRSIIQNTGFPLDSNTSGAGWSLVAVSYSMIVNNSYAWYQVGSGSGIRSLGNNHIANNNSTYGSLITSTLQ